MTDRRTTAAATVTWAFYTREYRRHDVDRPEQTYAELGYPTPGGAFYRLPLLNVSVDGVSFVAPRELVGVSPGTTLRELVLCVGLLRIRGRLTLCHVTRDPDGHSVLGGRFLPVEAADERKLSELIAALEGSERA